MAWEDWIQGASQTLLGAYVSERAADRRAETELAKLQLQALGTGGYYKEGTAGTAGRPGGGLVLSPGLLLLAGGVLLVVLMQDE